MPAMGGRCQLEEGTGFCEGTRSLFEFVDSSEIHTNDQLKLFTIENDGMSGTLILPPTPPFLLYKPSFYPNT